ncbi:MAG: hypothetical protein ACFHW5_22450 [Verrucomicrobiota bacterium]|jgi:hypothetical protein
MKNKEAGQITARPEPKRTNEQTCRFGRMLVGGLFKRNLLCHKKRPEHIAPANPISSHVVTLKHFKQISPESSKTHLSYFSRRNASSLKQEKTHDSILGCFFEGVRLI